MRRRDASSEPVDEANLVARTTYCIKCGRDLRGELISESCPDCLHSISDSVYGDGLISSPAESRRLYDASNLVFYPAVLLSILIAIALLATLLTVRSIIEDITIVFDVGFFGAMVTPTISVLGIFVLTQRRSWAYYRAKYGNARSLVTTGLVTTLIIIGVVLAVRYYGHLAGALVQVTWFAIPNAVFLRGLSDLMRRVQRKKLGNVLHAAFIWTYVVSIAALAVLILRRFAVDEPELEGPLIALTWLTVVAAVGLWGVVIRLLQLTRRTLHAARR